MAFSGTTFGPAYWTSWHQSDFFPTLCYIVFNLEMSGISAMKSVNSVEYRWADFQSANNLCNLRPSSFSLLCLSTVSSHKDVMPYLRMNCVIGNGCLSALDILLQEIVYQLCVFAKELDRSF